ncbi:molybdopterin-dependent oxidoreductase [Paenarthrobacter sp. PH39-S1]|uniref:molybdopterin-dependent oxidoreductase n=1 Tax=Paenarthrobacter sp. PH39-S1 TaxID=3046204 RepID=UPI0024BBD907|nr:molybdopterin-dependent oxidoreductase [Paenarthrobacter sp. PH39-S1]MDJ0357286.1 molybdopterin-dependent oxidoreductase [Paenarthrobacter sp. PH39-S1]
MRRLLGWLLRKIFGWLQGSFTSTLHSPRTAVVVGRLLGVAFVTCFFTGLYSHFLQDPLPWQPVLARPTWLYRLSQGTHVVTGVACIPLLLAKLWTVYPKLFSWPVITGVKSAVERASIALFVASSVLELGMGLLNVYKWYPWPFSFREVHFWLAWIIVGSLVIHIGVKLPLIHAHWRASRPATAVEHEVLTSRRGFVGAIVAAAAVLTVTTVGQAIPALGPVDLFAPRRPGEGPAALPVNRTAAEAKIHAPATDPAWALKVINKDLTRMFTLAELRAMPQTEVVLPIACVEGWSQNARWGGVRVRELLAMVGADPRQAAEVRSLETEGAYTGAQVPREYAWDELTLIALDVNGQPLDLEHGYPARLIAPNRPGVLQTKWLSSLEVR